MQRAESGAGGISLRHSLLRWLLPSVLIMLLISVISDYELAIAPTMDVYDQTLHVAALVVRDRIENDPDIEHSLKWSKGASALMSVNQSDQVYFSVYERNSRCLAGDCWLTPAWERWHPEAAVFRDIKHDAQPIRMLSYHFQARGRDLSIQVGETMNKRGSTERRILVGMMVPELLTILSVALMVVVGVRRGLAPLERVSRLVHDAPGSDTGSLPEQQMPSEIVGLVQTHNMQASRLQDSLRLQETFITNAAHQLRTPLAGLRAQVEVAMRLMAREPVSQELRHSIENTQRAAIRSARLVQQMLGLARSQTSAEDFVPCDLKTVAEHTVARLISQPEVARVDIGLEVEPACVQGIDMLLDELLGNLVDNACKYGGPGSRVTVRTGIVQGEPVLEVEDDGPGIPPADRERVFERFYRRDQGIDGVGLGLAIVREIADLHRARITLDDNGRGHGLRIILTFPACD